MLFDSGRGCQCGSSMTLSCLLLHITYNQPKISIKKNNNKIKVGEKGLESKILTHSYYSFVSFSFSYFFPFSFLAHKKNAARKKLTSCGNDELSSNRQTETHPNIGASHSFIHSLCTEPNCGHHAVKKTPPFSFFQY
jgi:hypothetical protein